MSPQDSHQDNAKTKPKPKKRQPVKKHDPQAERLAPTFAIIGCVGAVVIGVLAYYRADTPLVWVTFLTVGAFLVAIYFYWHSLGVKQICITLGLLLFIGCLIWQYRLSFPTQQISSAISTALPTPTPSLGEIPKIGASPSAATNGREFLDIEPEKLFAFFEKYNDAQAEELVQPYIGKWLEMQGRVREVKRDVLRDKDFRPIPNITVRMETARRDKKESSVWTTAVFDEKRWMDRAFVLKNDEDIRVRGQIKYIFAHSFRLEHCEIIE